MGENCNVSLEESEKLPLFIIYIPIFILGSLLNTLALWIFCWKLKKWTESIIYMTNLIISDCCLLLFLPFKIYSFYQNWGLGKELCFILYNIHYASMYTSIFIITAIAVDRYIAIRFPFRAKSWRSPLKAAVVCGVMWITIVTLSIPGYLEAHKKDDSLHCFQKTTIEPRKSLLVPVFFGFLTPLLLTTFCSVQVTCSLQKRNALNTEEEKLLKQVKCVIIVNLLVFIICFLPLHVMFLVRYFADLSGDCIYMKHALFLTQVFNALANSNCCLDAFCYYFVAKECREAYSGNSVTVERQVQYNRASTGCASGNIPLSSVS
ncbi:G-protein coupled receptor 35-like [Latimeria chalumnae]|uniref:G-protein coupled receptor 35-like n=1 Tax=Latimeria chalumnae TaxID=7897 RepID=UPI0003C167D7|nr:PREDICTED: G-protein coupled receptor 35-like [Latimeria chalumnae]|eukprot:XP_006012181.1 PREDICTED: G-protein coupled receptor 35-like [Latimeria chalumnae]